MGKPRTRRTAASAAGRDTHFQICLQRGLGWIRNHDELVHVSGPRREAERDATLDSDNPVTCLYKGPRERDVRAIAKGLDGADGTIP